MIVVRFHNTWLRCAAMLPLVLMGAAQAASLSPLYSFAGARNGAADAATPYAGLARDAAGNLYGSSYGGGAAGRGTVFMLRRGGPAGRPDNRSDWTETVIHDFSAGGVADGGHPMGAVILGVDGVLYGTTSTGGGSGNKGGGTVFALSPPASPGGRWGESVLTVFPVVNGSPAAPAARLLQDSSGALYGTTVAGGLGFGTVFRLTPPAAASSGSSGAWMATTLHVFSGQAAGEQQADGQAPLSGVTADTTGALYGTTEYSAGGSGNGTIYRLTPPSGGQAAWTEQVLFEFPGSGAYGSRPDGDLAIDTSGTVYGTAASGGERGNGTVFRLAAPAFGRRNWGVSVVYSFSGHSGDGGPEGGVVFGARGTLIGTTAAAGRRQQGTVYRLTPGTDAQQSWTEAVLARFPTWPAGGGLFPVGELVSDGSGGYVGVTELGGRDGAGLVFDIMP